MYRIAFLGSLSLAFALLCILRKKRYLLSTVQALITALMVLLSGTIGAFVMGFVETGGWSATSYYGAVFGVPLAMPLCAVLLKEPFLKLTDYIVPCGCAAVTIGKVFCRINGCCGGRVISVRPDGTELVFPSQLVEMFFGLVLWVFFLLIERKGKLKTVRYPLFMIMYGAGRFVLNYFRDTRAWFGLLPSGNVWSIAAILIGAFWMVNVLYLVSEKRSIAH